MGPDLETLLAPESCSLLEALEIIDKNVKRVCFVVTRDQKLVGSLTDGDIRRALIKGVPLTILAKDVAQTQCIWLPVSSDRNAIMKALKKVDFLPLLAEDRTVVDFASVDVFNAIHTRRVCVVTGTRAEYGILKPILRAIVASPRLELQLVVTGMHLLKKFGETYLEIEKDGFEIDKKVWSSSEETDSTYGTSNNVGMAVVGLTEALKELKPHILLAPCDRSEILAAAVAGFYMHTCVAHLHGGERSKTFDDSARHAISKLSHVHFVATEQSAERLKKMGEFRERIYNVGAPGLDSTLNQELLAPEDLASALGSTLDLTTPFLLVVQHPVDAMSAVHDIEETLEAVLLFKMPVVLVYPNNDAGGRKMIARIQEYSDLQPSLVHGFPSVPHLQYLALMKHAAVMVGNSSSGIIEAPSFHTPVVNVGDRQAGRERASSTYDVPCKRKAIHDAVAQALMLAEGDSVTNQAKFANPYGNGTAARQIISIMEDLVIDSKLLNKQIAY